MHRDTRVALVTNLPAHYRTPLFRRIGELTSLDVYYTSRGSEWYWTLPTHVKPREFSSVRPVRLFVLLVTGRYDVIVTSLVGRVSLLLTIAAAKIRRKPLIVWVGIWAHPETPVHRLSRPITRWLYRSASSLLVYGDHVRRYVEGESGRSERIFVLPQAVENTKFRVTDVSAHGPVPPNHVPRGVFVGRLEPGKGLDVLVHALATVRLPQIVELVGDGGLRAELDSLAASLGVRQRLAFRGFVDQSRLGMVLAEADFLILPSVTTARFKEPWGLVVNEAMNVGLPVIATDAVGAAAGGLVVDGETGFIVPEGNPEALAAAMDRLAGDADLRTKLGRSGRSRVLSWNFDEAAEVFLDAVHASIRDSERNRASPSRP